MKEKSELRPSLRSAALRLDAAEQAAASAHARSLLRRQPVWSAARAVLFYAPIAGEIDLTPLIQEALAAGRAVALPGFVPAAGVYAAFAVSDLARDCAPGKFGIREPRPSCAPIALNRLDLALVPGLGFDPFGQRLGRARDSMTACWRAWTGPNAGSPSTRRSSRGFPPKRMIFA